jgi:hypothetical protein
MHWNLIKKTINECKNENKQIDKLLVNNVNLTDPIQIANGLNNYFADVGKNLSDQIPDAPHNFSHYLNDPSPNEFSFSHISSNEVIVAINSLKNKKSNIENMPNHIYKLCNQEIAPHLARLFNESIIDGIYPNELKIAKLIPLFKTGDPTLTSNYRPISILPTIGKVFEKVVFRQLSNYLTTNNIISPNQFGFREGNTTNDAITTFLECIYENLNNKKSSILTFIDLSKAFDSVNHDILIEKLRHYGIRNTALNWFKSYLTNRSHYVTINNICSEFRTAGFGVPQGSILGPILFLLYINDFNNCHNALSYQYADDTTIITSDNNIERLYENTNSELEKIHNWLKANKLSLNLSKSVYMIISNKSNLAIQNVAINNISLQQVTEAKVLGIMLDNKLSFKSHIEHVGRKISKITYIIYRMKSYVPQKTLKLLYFALAYPHLMYNITVWGSASSHLLNKLVVQQKRLIRLVYGSQEYLAHTNPMFKELSLLKLTDIYKVNVSVYIYKIMHGFAPTQITNYIMKNQVIHNHRTRQDPLYIKLPQYSLEISCKAFSYKGPKIFNDLNLSIKSSPSLHIFKRNLIKATISGY